MANFNLTGQKIKNTYGQVAQVNDSNKLVDGLGNEKQIVTSSIVNFPTEVSRSAAEAGFGAGQSIDTSSLVENSTFNAYTSSNDSAVSVLDTRVDSLTSATSSYLTSLPSGVVSGSSQISYSGITDVPSGLVSSSAQTIANLPSGTISGSSQVDLSLATGTAANATSASFAVSASYAPTILPSGVVSGSSQIDLGSATGTAANATSASYAVTASYAMNAGGGSAGLVAGAGTDSMRSSNDLTTTGATAAGDNAISLGNGTDVNGNGGLAIGNGATVGGTDSIAIGTAAGSAGAQDATIAIGLRAQYGDSYGVAVGADSRGGYQGTAVGYGANGSSYGIALGASAQANNDYAISIGAFGGTRNTQAGLRDIAIGSNVENDVDGHAIAIGSDVINTGTDSNIAIGKGVRTSGLRSIAIGSGSSATNNDEINIGDKIQYNNDGNGEIKLSGSVRVPTSTLTITSNTASVDCGVSNFFSLANAGGSNLVANPTNIQDGSSYVFKITNGVNLTWGSTYKFEGGTPPTLSAGTDVVTFVSIGGTELYGTYLSNLS